MFINKQNEVEQIKEEYIIIQIAIKLKLNVPVPSQPGLNLRLVCMVGKDGTNRRNIQISGSRGLNCAYHRVPTGATLKYLDLQTSGRQKK